MPEHRIKLRAGWESTGIVAEASRLSLPIAWPEGRSGTIRLTRRFGRPPLDPETETAWLELQFVSGLRSVRLNEVDLGLPQSADDGWRAPLGGLLDARNELRLEVDLGLVDPVQRPEGWGWIALVIVSNRSAGDPNEPAGGVGSWTEMP